MGRHAAEAFPSLLTSAFVILLINSLIIADLVKFPELFCKFYFINLFCMRYKITFFVYSIELDLPCVGLHVSDD